MSTPEAPDAQPKPPSHLHSLLWAVALAVTVFALGFTPLRASFDEWWHLKSGRYISEHGLPKNDIFTYTADDLEWHNHEWLSQVFLWKVFEFGERNNWGGIRTIQFFKSIFLIISYLALGWFLMRKSGSSALAGLAVLLAFGLTRRTLYFRPPFLTYGILILVLILLMQWRAGGKKRFAPLIALPPLFALWANLHGGFMAGLVFVGAFWTEAVVDVALAKWRKEDAKPAMKSAIGMGALLVSCVVGTCANPYTWHLYELAVRVMGDKALVALIFELLPPDWGFVWMVDAIIVLLACTLARPSCAGGWVRVLAACALFVLVVQLFPRWLYPTPGEKIDAVTLGAWMREIVMLILLTLNAIRAGGRVGFAVWSLNIFFAHQAIQHVRHLPLFGIVAAPFIAFTLADWMNGPAEKITGSASESHAIARRKRWMPRAAAVWTVSLAAFYLLWPGEVINTVRAIAKQPAEFLRNPISGSNLKRNLELLRGTEVLERDYPIAAVDHLLRAKLPGRIWNAANYAGYLIWRLSPEKYQVFTDTRYDIWGGKFLLQEIVVKDGFPGDPSRKIPSWNEVLDRWQVNTIFIPTAAALHPMLKSAMSDPRAIWRLEYEDQYYAIWTRNQPIAVTEFDEAKEK